MQLLRAPKRVLPEPQAGGARFAPGGPEGGAVKRRYRHPLLVTRCDICLRRRACHVIRVWGGLLCRQCIDRVIRAGKVALAEFALQARKGRR